MKTTQKAPGTTQTTGLKPRINWWRGGVCLVVVVLTAVPLARAAYVPADCGRGRYVPEDWWSLQLRDLRELTIRRARPAEDNSVIGLAELAKLAWAELPPMAQRLLSIRARRQQAALAESIARRWRRREGEPAAGTLLELAFCLGRQLPADVQDAWSRSLCQAYGVDVAAEAAWPTSIAARLVAALAELGDSASAGRAAAKWILSSEAFRAASLEELAYIAYGLVGTDEHVDRARARLARHIGRHCIVDRSLVKATPLLVWRVLVRRLDPSLTLPERQLWARMLREVYYQNDVPFASLGGEAMHLFDAMRALNDLQAVQRLASWLDTQAGWADYEAYILVWHLARQGKQAEQQRRELIKHISLEIISDPARVRRIEPRAWHIISVYLKEYLSQVQRQQWAATLHAEFAGDVRQFEQLCDLDKYHVVKMVGKHLGRPEIRDMISAWINQGQSWRYSRPAALALLLNEWRDSTEDKRQAMARLADHLSDKYAADPGRTALVELGDWFTFAAYLNELCPDHPARPLWAAALVQAFAMSGDSVAALDEAQRKSLLATLGQLGRSDVAGLLTEEQRLQQQLRDQPVDRALASALMDVIMGLEVFRMAGPQPDTRLKRWQGVADQLRRLADVGGQLGPAGSAAVDRLARQLGSTGPLAGEQVVKDLLGLSSDLADGFNLRMVYRRLRLDKALSLASEHVRQAIRDAAEHRAADNMDKAAEAYGNALTAVEKDGAERELTALLRWTLLDVLARSAAPDQARIDRQIAALYEAGEVEDGDLAHLALWSLLKRVADGPAGQTKALEAGLAALPPGPVWVDQPFLDALTSVYGDAKPAAVLPTLTNLMLMASDVQSLRCIQAERLRAMAAAGNVQNARGGANLYALLGLADWDGPWAPCPSLAEMAPGGDSPKWLLRGSLGVDEPLRVAAEAVPADTTMSPSAAVWLAALSGKAQAAAQTQAAPVPMINKAANLQDYQRNHLLVGLVLDGVPIGEAVRLADGGSGWYRRWQRKPLLWGASALGRDDDVAAQAWALAIDAAPHVADVPACVKSIVDLVNRPGVFEPALAALAKTPQHVTCDNRRRAAWAELGGQLCDAGRFAAAVDAFEEGDAIGPAAADEGKLAARLKRVAALSQLGRYAEAMGMLEAAKDWAGDPEQKARALFLRGWLCVQMGQWAKAHDALELVARQYPDCSAADEAARLTPLVDARLKSRSDGADRKGGS